VSDGRPVVGIAADRDRVADHLGDRAEVHNNIGRHHRGAAGMVFLAAMANEFFIASVRPGWRWVHVLMAIIFLAAARPQLAASHAPAVCLRRWRYLAAGAQMAADAPTRLQQGEVRPAWSWSGSR